MGTLVSFSKSATNTALNWSELALLLFGIILVLGLVGEYVESERWNKHLKLFEMLVIIGVLGELVGDGGVFLFSNQLQVISESEIADANKKAGDAKTSAEGASAAARRADADAGNAHQKADIVAQQANDLRTKYVSAERDLIALKAKSLPRRLSSKTSRTSS